MLSKEKAEKIIVALRAAAIMDELTPKRIRQICKGLGVGPTVVIDAAISAGILARPKRGVYFFRSIDMNPPARQIEDFITIANGRYRDKARDERYRKSKRAISPSMPGPDPAPELTFEQRLDRLERLFSEMLKGRRPHSQLELIQGGEK